MKPDELMLRDWVLMGDKPYKVASLSCMENPELESDKYIFHCLKDEIAPIPLTPEILEKNGFEFKQQGSLELAILKMKNRNPITLEYIGWSGGRWAIHEHRLIVRYVHELQHALRLFSINKEIEI